MNLIGKNIVLLGAWLLLFAGGLFAQGNLEATVVDETTGEKLEGATVFVMATTIGAYSDGSGSVFLTGIKAGTYSVRVSYVGYVPKEITGVAIKEGGTTTLNVKMVSKEKTFKTIVIEGEAKYIDVDDGKSEIKIGQKDIAQMNVDDVKEIIGMQVGVSITSDGPSIRGGRPYETLNLIEGLTSRDALSGTGFGVDVASGSVGEVTVNTGGADAEYGNGTSGVINTKLKEGGDNYHFGGSWSRDNLGWGNLSFSGDERYLVSWNTDKINFSLDGPVPFTAKKDSLGNKKERVFFYISADARLTDTYFGTQANQLHTTMFTGNDSLWAPRQDNHWSSTFKLSWNVKPGTKLTLFNQHSLNINQNSRTLQIVGNDAILVPGFPYVYSLNLDNATTYAHQSNLTGLNLSTLLSPQWTLNVTAGRLFTNLRADANGRPFRESTVDQIFDPASIVSDPVDVFNPDDEVVYVFPGPGLYNNGGISTRWHDHYAEEYTLKYKFTWSSKDNIHFMSFGQEHKEQEYQWIDVTRPWVGAPIFINDSTTTPSTSLGSSSDLWKVKPAMGGFFFQDEIRYKGIVAYLGGRFDYWAPGKFADEAVANPDAPVTDAVREQYLKQSAPFLGRRWKARLLPKVRVSFPITPGNVLYFNYGHSTLMPHPRFIYAGLDPTFQDRSFLSNLGNPNINPEVTVNYEVGLKTQIEEAQMGLQVTAFYNDKFDYIVSRLLLIRDQTGRFVPKTFFINQDYARIRGVELTVIKAFEPWFKGTFTASYQAATGKSNTAAESALQIQTQGFVNTTKEQFLAWDRPYDMRMTMLFKGNDTLKLFGKLPSKGWRFFMTSTLKAGLRYTPFELTDTADSGRPIYERIDDQPFSEFARPWFWTDVKLSRDIFFNDNKSQITFSAEVRNLFNNKNAQIVNGVTGRAYEPGDPLPNGFRDPNYPDPQDNGIPPTNPARYRTPIQTIFGINFRF